MREYSVQLKTTVSAERLVAMTEPVSDAQHVLVTLEGQPIAEIELAPGERIVIGSKLSSDESRVFGLLLCE